MRRAPTGQEIAAIRAGCGASSTRGEKPIGVKGCDYPACVCDLLPCSVRAAIGALKDPPHAILDAGREHVKTTPSMMTAAWNAMIDEILKGD